MISVRNLTKRYPEVVAVDDISFEIQAGEVIGFLGPNGAGKSTTLKILTGYLPATRGSAQIDGLDVVDDSLSVRSQVGYLPENVPLYLEMRVQEYLTFRARLKGLNRKDALLAVDEKVVLCGLEPMRRRLIGHLSKGYRQRVGLADSMLGDPKVLILDEPTAGLDPAQRKEVRDLIAKIGEQRTILLSSHILGEVESISDRVIIIARGKIQAQGTTEELAKTLGRGHQLRVETRFDSAGIQEWAKGFSFIKKVTSEPMATSFHTHFLTLDDGIDPREQLLESLVQNGAGVRAMSFEGVSLEEAFLHLTAKAAMDVTPVVSSPDLEAGE